MVPHGSGAIDRARVAEYNCAMSMKRELIIVRHGEAEHLIGEDRMTGGWTDTKLTPLGRMQAERTADALAREIGGREFGFHCSDLSRARETAEIIGERLYRIPISSHAIREFNNGCAAGMKHAAAESIKAPLDGPIGEWRPFCGGENWNEFLARVSRFGEEYLSSGLHLVVCHSGTAFNLVFWFLGLTSRYVGQIYTELDPCGIIRLGTSPYGENTIHRLNDTSHLAGPTLFDKTPECSKPTDGGAPC